MRIKIKRATCFTLVATMLALAALGCIPPKPVFATSLALPSAGGKAGTSCGEGCIWSSLCAQRAGVSGTICVQEGFCHSCAGVPATAPAKAEVPTADLEILYRSACEDLLREPDSWDPEKGCRLWKAECLRSGHIFNCLHRAITSPAATEPPTDTSPGEIEVGGKTIVLSELGSTIVNPETYDEFLGVMWENEDHAEKVVSENMFFIDSPKPGNAVFVPGHIRVWGTYLTPESPRYPSKETGGWFLFWADQPRIIKEVNDNTIIVDFPGHSHIKGQEVSFKWEFGDWPAPESVSCRLASFTGISGLAKRDGGTDYEVFFQVDCGGFRNRHWVAVEDIRRSGVNIKVAISESHIFSPVFEGKEWDDDQALKIAMVAGGLIAGAVIIVSAGYLVGLIPTAAGGLGGVALKAGYFVGRAALITGKYAVLAGWYALKGVSYALAGGIILAAKGVAIAGPYLWAKVGAPLVKATVSFLTITGQIAGFFVSEVIKIVIKILFLPLTLIGFEADLPRRRPDDHKL